MDLRTPTWMSALDEYVEILTTTGEFEEANRICGLDWSVIASAINSVPDFDVRCANAMVAYRNNERFITKEIREARQAKRGLVGPIKAKRTILEDKRPPVSAHAQKAGKLTPVRTLARKIEGLSPNGHLFLLEKLFSNLRIIDGCWFHADTRRNEHTTFTSMEESHPTHRWTYVLLKGKYPEGTHLHHTCQRKACFNPEHLIPLTPLEHSRAHYKLERGPYAQTAQGVADTWPGILKVLRGD